MAYTLLDRDGDCQPIRLIVPDAKGVPALKDAFTPHWWVCDPCNRSSERYEVTYREGQAKPTCLAWYEVVTTDDTPDDVAVKLDFYRRVLAAREAMDAASIEYRRLTGCGWSATPL